MSSSSTTTDAHPRLPHGLFTPQGVGNATVLLLLLGMVTLWTLAVGLSHSAPDRDGMEELIWASSLELGYSKHPPLPSWIMYAATQIFGRPIWLPFFVGQLCSALALWFIWKLGCEFTTPPRSLSAVLLLSTIAYFGMRGTIFNHNTVQLAPLAAAAWLFHRALRTGRTRAWMALGLVSGLALLTKYSAVIQFAAFAIFLLHRRREVSSATIQGVAIATLIGLLVFSPHLYWLAQHDFAPILYADESIVSVSRLSALKSIGNFLIDQLLRLAPMVIAVAILARHVRRKAHPVTSATVGAQPTWASALSTWDRSFVLWVGLAPLLSTVVISIILGTNLEASWATTFFILFGFYAFWWLRGEDGAVLRATLITVIVLQVCIAVGYGLARGPIAWHLGKPSRSTYPGLAVSRAMQAVWQQHEPGVPLQIVASDMWLGGNIAVHAGRDVDVFLDADYQHAPWLNPASALHCGALVAYSTEPRGYLSPQLEQLYARTTEKGELSVRWSSERSPMIKISWGILPPTQACDAGNSNQTAAGRANTSLP
ncbi:hypothetical protein GSY71_13335 [Pusillimonas sp. TS35]|uniref:glycosyltransferase family 39 protein n=1 Tax=Paracandidimonas lactea TaxID=2895524 RepID=UPI001371448A|nr:glycosyltransferase family 39 protein [Paracandidimonas lactea]MYN14123.1 hypothetical protein [Pusillimonas sp. TS35]